MLTRDTLTDADYQEIDSLTYKLMDARGGKTSIIVRLNGCYYYQRLAMRIYLSRMNGNRYGDLASL